MAIRIRAPQAGEQVATQAGRATDTFSVIMQQIVRAISSLTSRADALEAIVSAPAYTVATLPSAATAGQIIYVSDETGGAVIAFSDGTNWRRVQDRAVVS